MKKKNIDYTGSQAIMSLVIPLSVWLVFWGITWLQQFFDKTYL
ncbi:hypothetical protein [Bacillus solimangrovi]|nr:hypothetical protein [Bacillus solimangrovi]